MTRRGFGFTAMAAAFALHADSHTDELYAQWITVDSLCYGRINAFPKLAESGPSAVVSDMQIYPRDYPSALEYLVQWSGLTSEKNSPVHPILRRSDFALAKERRKIGVVLASQDASILGASTASVSNYNLDNLKNFYSLGLRVLQLSHNDRSAYGDSYQEKRDGGLSRGGEKVVRLMNDLGMIVDLSHCSKQTLLDTVQLSGKPVAVTHAGCRALFDSARNKTDEEIRALGRNGGYFGVFNMTLWLTSQPAASLDTVIDHMDHVASLIGPDHVGFGSDGDLVSLNAEGELAGLKNYHAAHKGAPGSETVPQHARVPELNSPQRMLHLAEALSRRKFSDDVIKGMIGGNFVRFFGQVCG